ncbi:MAG TPA: 4Fe-4S binding protein [Candidatus Bathyarchaeia archaeon]|nr:4Fe-4S binding protein [Candidatus Bathyarchaeia archaeon]
MSERAFEQLAKALDKLPNGFPQTPSRIEIQILKKIFSPDEASLAGQLGGKMETAEVIAGRVGLSVQEASSKLMSMAERGLLWYSEREGKPRFRLAPFVVGIYEAQLETLDHELAHMVEKYLSEGGAAGIMKPQPALHRVIPAQKAMKSEWILPYDDVKAVLLASKVFNVRDCICRAQQDYIGRKCSFPVKMCLNFSAIERPASPGDITQEEALAILDKAEEIGLVHTVSNVMKGFGYVCNCCGCCCGILRGITDWGIENSVAYANYYSVINPDECQGCGTCITRCQVHAITDQNGISVVDRERCIGCGLCVTGCPNGAAQLERKPESQIVNPPADFTTWEQQRLLYRGLDHQSEK